MSQESNITRVLFSPLKVYNCIQIENTLTEEGDFENILQDYKQYVPGKNN